MLSVQIQWFGFLAFIKNWWLAIIMTLECNYVEELPSADPKLHPSTSGSLLDKHKIEYKQNAITHYT